VLVFLLVTLKQCEFSWIISYLKFLEESYNNLTRKEKKFKIFAVPLNNMQTLKFKAQLTNDFFATINQMFGGSSQLPTTAEYAVIKSNH